MKFDWKDEQLNVGKNLLRKSTLKNSLAFNYNSGTFFYEISLQQKKKKGNVSCFLQDVNPYLIVNSQYIPTLTYHYISLYPLCIVLMLR